MPIILKCWLKRDFNAFWNIANLKDYSIKSRMDVYMENLKTVSNKEIYDLDAQDVLKFLIYKDVNDFGRTLVHHFQCPNVGTKSNEHCGDNVKCGLRHQSESMRVGIVDKLRKAFEDVGRKGPSDPETQLGDQSFGDKSTY